MKNPIITALCGFALLTGCAEFAQDAPELPPVETPAEQSDGPSSSLLEEVERFLADMGATVSADWNGARLTGEAIPLYRPDLEAPAYYELPVDPEGFVVVATGDHDWKIAHWATRGIAPTAQLREKAASGNDPIEKYYKLDTLTYAAEDASGRLVAQLGALPQRLAIDPAEADPSSALYERSWVPEVDDDGEVAGGQIITRKITATVEGGGLWAADNAIVGRESVRGGEATTSQSPTPNLEMQPFDSWQALKADYAGTFRPHLDSLRANVTARTQLIDPATAPVATEAPSRSSLRSTGYENGFFWWAADGNAAELTYNQIAAQTWPNPTSCSSGCGATAWAMLFGWADREAANGSPKWHNHGGIYRQDGGYGTDVKAPTFDSVGINLMKMEIRGYIKTFCWFNSGATYPGDMIGAWNYLTGRDYSMLHTTYNVFGFANGGNSQAAVDVILGEQSPVIIGVGWLTHYPLAHAFAWHPDHGSFFIVNQGWGYGGAEGVPASSWFHGQLVWVP